MGSGNVAIALDRWSAHLNDKPFRALMRMAVVSMDGEDSPRYWGGWPPLARAVGATFPAECDAHDPSTCSHGDRCRGRACHGCKGCQAAQRAVTRAVQGLLATGAIHLVHRAANGRNAEYALQLSAVPTPVDKPGRYGTGVKTSPTLSVQQQPDAQRPATARRSASGMPDAQRRADYKQEDSPGTQPGTTSPKPGTSPGAEPVDPAGFDQRDVQPPGDPPTCEHGEPIRWIGRRGNDVPACGDCRRQRLRVIRDPIDELLDRNVS
jgi:hypothetical protein